MSEPAVKPWYVQAHYNWEATKEGQVPLVRGGIYCVTQELDHGWSLGIDAQNNQGFFPTAYTKRLTAEQEQRLLQRQAQAKPADGQAEQPAAAQQAQPQAAQPQAQQPQAQQPAAAQPAQQQQQQQPAAAAQAQPRQQPLPQVPQQQQQQASAEPVAEAQPVGGVAAAGGAQSAEPEAPARNPPVRPSGSQMGGEAASEAGEEGEEKKKHKSKKHKKKKGETSEAGEKKGKERKKSTASSSSSSKKKKTRTKSGVVAVNSSVSLFKHEQLNADRERRWSINRLGAKELGESLQQQQVDEQLQRVVEQEQAWQHSLAVVHKGLVDAEASGDANAKQAAVAAYTQAEANQQNWIADCCRALAGRYQGQCTAYGQEYAGQRTHLDRLVGMQQGRCFADDAKAYTEANKEQVAAVLQAAGVSASSKRDPLDAGIDAIRESSRSLLTKVNDARSMAEFFQNLQADSPIATCYVAMSRTLATLLAGAFASEGEASSASGSQVQHALGATVDVGGTSVTVSTVLRKLVHAWDAMHDGHKGVTDSLSEEFSHAVTFLFVEVYQQAIAKLSLSGAVSLADAAVPRMLFLIASNQVDVTRDPVGQLVYPLSATVTPEQLANIAFEHNVVQIPCASGSVVDVPIPARLNTRGEAAALLSRNGAPREAPAGDPTVFWSEAKIVANSAWSSGVDTYVKANSTEQFGKRHVSSAEGLAFIKEQGWYRAAVTSGAQISTQRAQPAGQDLGAVGSLGERLAELEERNARQDDALAEVANLKALIGQLQATVESQAASIEQLKGQLSQARSAPAPAAARPLPTPTQPHPQAGNPPQRPAQPQRPPQAQPQSPAAPQRKLPVPPPRAASPSVVAEPEKQASNDLEMFSGDEFDDSWLDGTPAEPTPMAKPRAAPLRKLGGSQATAVAAQPAAAAADGDFDYAAALGELDGLADGDGDSETATASVHSDSDEFQ